MMSALHQDKHRLLVFYPMPFIFEVPFPSTSRFYIRECPPTNPNEIYSGFSIFDIPTEQFCKRRLPTCGRPANLQRIRKNFKKFNITTIPGRSDSDSAFHIVLRLYLVA